MKINWRRQLGELLRKYCPTMYKWYRRRCGWYELTFDEIASIIATQVVISVVIGNATDSLLGYPRRYQYALNPYFPWIS